MQSYRKDTGVDKASSFSTVQIVFLASIVALDFAFGMVVKNVLSPTGLLNLVRLDMVFPVVLMMLTRLLIDRRGTLLIYQLAWGMLAVLAMPAAYGLPGFLKLMPAFFQGLAYETAFCGLRRMPRLRVFAAALAGGLVSRAVIMLLRLALGLPWSRAIVLLWGLQALNAALINLLGAALALYLWPRIAATHLAMRIGAAHD